MKLSAFDIPRGAVHYITLPSGRSINVHVADRDTYGVDVHVQSNSDQWPAEYSDSLRHTKQLVSVCSSPSTNLSHQDIEFLQDTFSKDAANV